ncbi:hypothetical protein ACIRQP_11230 [Streptomyces sp. NPDC102274]|uniref:hypothetical protein n=1 Tax=Streptomyces sp. NPDC102274 TaxID=3366151 RepID=UPI003804444B
MRRRLKMAAVLVVVVLALTGFSSSTSGKSGKSKGSSGSGGGCSNSKKSNGSYSGSGSDYDSDDDYGSSGSSYGDPTPTATTGAEARIVTCVSRAKGKRKAVTYATVRVTAGHAPAGRTDIHGVDVTFEDASGSVVDFGDAEVELQGGQTTTVRVPMDSPKQVSRVRKCEATVRIQ